MKHFNSCPGWAFKILTSLCISHIKQQLSENLIYEPTNPHCFVLNGDLFAYTNNRLLIADEAETGFAMLVN